MLIRVMELGILINGRLSKLMVEIVRMWDKSLWWKTGD
jgi:hypothetical protein